MTDPESRADQARHDALDPSRRRALGGSSVLHQTEPPEEEWDEFCDSFSESHRGWIVTLRSVDTELLEIDPTRAFEEGRVLVRGEVLSDVRLVHENGGVHIDLHVGEGPGGGSHVVEQPVRLLVKRTHEGADAGLRVDAQDGHSALLLFRVPARPAELDGIAPAELEQPESRTVIPLREEPDALAGRGGNMKVMKRADWPALMDGAQRSVLVLAPWIDDELIKELFSFLPPVDVRIVFPRSTLENEEAKAARYALRGVLDTNFDAEIRISDDELPACLVVDGEEFYYSETYADRLAERASDRDAAIAYATTAWDQARPWE